MQLISWTVARLGSRFSLLFEPSQRQVRHSALGRFLDEPLDLAVGLVEPDGRELVLPFTPHGEVFYNPEQFERFNSITYRAYSQRYKLRFEFNIHSLFYPQNEKICLMPVFYLEMRVNPIKQVRWSKPADRTPSHVKLFLRINRPNTLIKVGQLGDKSYVSMDYRSRLTPRNDGPHGQLEMVDDGRTAQVQERIVSLNADAAPDPGRNGLSITLPVTEVGSGTKWRLVWGAYTGDPVLQFKRDGQTAEGRFHYTKYWNSLDEVLHDAITTRDDGLALSRRLEKAVEQTPLRQAQRHLVHQTFQNYLANTFWCDIDKPVADLPSQWFSVWEGSCYFHSTLDVEYNIAPFYLGLWPDLLAMQLSQWPLFHKTHQPSGGIYLHHDAGSGTIVSSQAYSHDMPVEENCNYLLLLQTYTRMTGQSGVAQKQAQAIEKMASYLLWTDRDNSGFPSEGVANTIDDGSPALQFSRKQTYLAIKRLSGLRAAADLLTLAGKPEAAEPLTRYVMAAIPKIEDAAWLGDHYAICADSSATGLVDAWTDQPLPFEELEGWDGYSIYTGNGLLLPLMCGQSLMFDKHRLITDLLNAGRETLSPYGCGHSSNDPDNVWISQNLWRDQLGRYMGLQKPTDGQDYWDLQTMSNTGAISLGFVDTYIGNNLSFYPRGAVSLGIFFSGPRLVIDRLAPGGGKFSVSPDTNFPQRWPLMALADWKAGKIPICVVSNAGKVSIESETDPITIEKM